MYKKIISFTMVCSMIMVSALLAQDFTWENIGTASLDFQVFLFSAQDSKIILAGQSGNMFKSDNAGKSWRRVLAIRSQMRNITALAMGQNDSSVIYAATDNGVYRSNNSGEQWERIFRGKNNQENQCTAVGIGAQTILVGTKAGLFISQDNGRCWHKQTTGIGNSSILNIDTSFGQNKIIYLAAENGIFKSLDNGQSWKKIFIGNVGEESEEDLAPEDEEASGKRLGINFVKADKNNTSLVYFSSAKGVYKSLDQGKSWEKLTEYCLLNRNVKMLCLSNSLGVLALTSSGAFLYLGERWLEISFGLATGKLNYLVLDRLNNIYISAEKGIYKLNPGITSSFKCSSILGEYRKYEPSIKEVQEAAIKYAQVSPEKISQWRRAVAKKAFLPKISVGLDRNSTDLWHWEGGSTTKGEDDLLRRGRDNIDWDVSLSWDLSDLIWNDAQTSIDVRSKLMVQLRPLNVHAWSLW